jgi:hypothetical protein
MAYFPHAYCKTLLGSAATPVLDGTPGTTLTTALTPGQIGIVSAKDHTVQDLNATPTYADVNMIYIAQGSFYQNDKLGPHHGGYQETVKSKGINPKYVSKLYKTVSANALNEIVQIDVAEDCTDALRHLTHNAYVNAPAFTGCCDDANSNIDPCVVVLGWADYINDHAPISPFVQATAYSDINHVPAETATASAAADITLSGAIAHVAGDRVVWELDAAATAPNGVVDGYTFTCGAGVTDIFSVGMVITGTNILAGTKIVRLVSGDGGAGSVFEVDIHNPVASTGVVTGETTVTAYADNSGTTTLSLEAAETLATSSGTAITSTFTSTGTALTVWRALDSDTFTASVGAAADNNNCMLELVSAYADTQFGDCSFDPKDHYEREPVEIYASIVDESGNPCETTCFSVVEVQDAQQGKGFGETVLREMIQFKRYRQEDFKTDPRMREVLGETVLDDIGRTTKYSALYILHSVPRKANPSGTFDNDQYLVKICFPDAQFADATVGQMETWIEALLADAGNPLTFEALA